MISLICSGVMGFSSVLGVFASSSLLLFAAFAFGFEADFFFAELSVVGALGVESLSLAPVFGVFAGYCDQSSTMIRRIPVSTHLVLGITVCWLLPLF